MIFLSQIQSFYDEISANVQNPQVIDNYGISRYCPVGTEARACRKNPRGNIVSFLRVGLHATGVES